MDEPVKKTTPFGIPRVCFVAAAFVVVCVTGMAVGAADPLQQLMQLNGAFRHLNEEERKIALESILNFGLSFSVLSGAVVGPFMDFCGTKVTALTGLILHALGYILFFFNDIKSLYYVGSICFGFAFQCILNAHFNVGALFPDAPNLILAIISAGPDLSYFVPPTLLSLAQRSSVRHIVFLYLLLVVGSAFVLDLFLVPLRPFTAESSFCEAPEGADLERIATESDPLLLEGGGGGAAAAAVKSTKRVSGIAGDQPPTRSEVSTAVYAGLPLKKQLRTPEYWVFLPFFIFAFLRRKHMVVSIRSIFRELDPDPTYASADFYTSLYSTLVPYGFTCAMIWGALVDRVGVIVLTFAANAVCCTYIIFSMIPIMALQGVTVILFIIAQAFVFGHLLAFLASTYGFDTLATLQGMASTIAGVCSIVVDLYWSHFIAKVLHSYRVANAIVLGISVVMFSVPVALFFLRLRKVKKQTKLNQLEPSREFDNLLPQNPVYDRASLTLLKRRVTLRS